MLLLPARSGACFKHRRQLVEHAGGARRPGCSSSRRTGAVLCSSTAAAAAAAGTSQAPTAAPTAAPAPAAPAAAAPTRKAQKPGSHPQPVPADLLHLEQSHGHWAGGVHYCVMEVRDYELDQFQVVNNAIYASYVQHARHKALASLGMPVEQFQQQGVLMALSELALQYKAPLRAGDTFYVTTAVAQVSAARLVIEHTVQQVPARSQQPQVVCTAQATVVFLDRHYRPTRVPQAPRQVFLKLAAEYSAAGDGAAAAAGAAGA